MQKENPLTLETESGRIFASASKQYSSSVTAQGAFICLRLDRDLGKILREHDMLIHHTRELDRLTFIANRQHEHLRRLPEIDVDQVIRIINLDFKLAKDFAVLEPMELQEIVDAYQGMVIEERKRVSSSSPHVEVNIRPIEQDYRNWAYDKVEKAKKRNSFWRKLKKLFIRW